MTDDVVRTERAGRVGHVLLNRPAARNAVTVELAQALEQAVRSLAEDVDVIVLRGAGGNFCAGGDVDELVRLSAAGRDGLATLLVAFRTAISAIEQVDVPVVAAVEGYAVAGGCEIVQAADVAVVRDDARLADNHARFGQIPSGGGSQRLVRLVGRARARGLILTGDTISGTEAVAWGLAYRCAPAPEFEAAVDDTVARLLRGSRPALAASKRLVRMADQLPLEEGLDAELTAALDHLTSAAGAAALAGFTDRER